MLTEKDINLNTENWSKKFDKEFGGDVYFLARGINYEDDSADAVVTSEVKAFIHKTLLHREEELLRKAEELKTKMKETHICGFNDGECDCKCYLEAIEDCITLIKNK